MSTTLDGFAPVPFPNRSSFYLTVYYSERNKRNHTAALSTSLYRALGEPTHIEALYNETTGQYALRPSVYGSRINGPGRAFAANLLPRLTGTTETIRYHVRVDQVDGEPVAFVEEPIA